MGTPLIYEVAERPATSIVIALLICVWLFLQHRRWGYAEVGLSYEAIFGQKEYWRIVTAQLSHVEVLHLIFNCSALWSLGQATSLEYLHTSCILLLLSGLLCLATYHLLIKVLGRDEYGRVTAVGYSCVTFGLMASRSRQGSFSVAGLLHVPMWVAPFGSLMLTSLIFPRASFVGHLSGIIAGFLVAAGAFAWLTPLELLSLAAWALVLSVADAVCSGRLQLPFVVLLDSNSQGSAQVDADLEAGAPVRILR